jgi:hypothetical protein
MEMSLKNDLQRLSELAYHRLEWCGKTVKALHRLRKTVGKHPDFPGLEKACGWLFVPFTLWAIDFQGLCGALIQRIEAGERLEEEMRLLIDSLPALPPAKVQAVVSAHEHAVQLGDYEAQVKAGEKYRLLEEKLMATEAFREEWQRITTAFSIAEHQDHKGIIRRRMISERGFRADWETDWNDSKARFQAVFDVFCQRWNLYGMMNDQPLLQKLTVNLTPHGTMIFVPSWWSLDSKRDLNWSEIKQLHRVRVPSKQGPKLTRNQMEQAAEAKRAALFEAQARAKGLKGEVKDHWVMKQMRWQIPDARRLRLLRKRAKELAG